MACCAISNDWLLASRRRFRVVASASVAKVMPCSLRVTGSRQQTVNEAEPSFLVRLFMLAMGKMLRRCPHFSYICPHSATLTAADLRKHCARGGTRTHTPFDTAF